METESAEKTAKVILLPAREPHQRPGWLVQKFRISRRNAFGYAFAIFGIGISVGFIAGTHAPDLPVAVPSAQATQIIPKVDDATKEMGWLDDVAASHRNFASQKADATDLSGVAAKSAVSWLSASIGIAFILPDLTADGFEFKGARLVLAAGKPAAQLFYRGVDGETVAIGVVKSDAARESAPGKQDEVIRDDVAMVYWTKPGSAYVVSGPSSDARLLDLARKVSSAI